MCWAHGRRHFFALADIAAPARMKAKTSAIASLSPMALEAVRRIDALFDIEREISGQSAEERPAVRQERSRPLVDDLETWMRAERAKLSCHAPVAKAMDYLLHRWPAFARFLDDGRVCLTNNSAERALRGIAFGRKSWLFCGSDRGGERAAVMYTLIGTAKLNGLYPQAWLADVLARLPGYPAQKLDELMPWNWRAPTIATAAAVWSRLRCSPDGYSSARACLGGISLTDSVCGGAMSRRQSRSATVSGGSVASLKFLINDL